MDKNPFDKVLDQIGEIMQYAYDNANKPVHPKKAKELDDQLEELEKQVKLFSQMSDKLIEGVEVNDYLFQSMLEDEKNEKISKADRDMLVRAQVLKIEAEKASKDALQAANAARASGKKFTEKKKAKAKSPQARKGKFKSMGGYKDWKPL